MKFLFSPDIRQNNYLRTLLISYFTLVLLFLCSNPFYEYTRFGLTPEAIRNSILGNRDLYIEAQDLVTIVSEVHIHLFVYSLVVLTTLSVFLHLRVFAGVRTFIAALLAGSVLADSIAVLAVHFLSPKFALVKAVAFWSLELALAATVLLNLSWLMRRSSG